MTEQRERIKQSVEYIKANMPKGFSANMAIYAEEGFDIDGLKEAGKIKCADIPPAFESQHEQKSKLIFGKLGGKNVIVIQGRYHFYDGYKMRDIGHVIYVLKYLGVKKLITIDEVGHLNPRYSTGEIALIYDHINLMGDNPLIGKNDDELGVRFPDMSNAYDRDLFAKAYKVLQDNNVRINEAIYVGVTGPESETDAEARFYREIGGDVAGYSTAAENITAVHCGLKHLAIGLITRDLVADKMMEDERSDKERMKDKKKALSAASNLAAGILKDIVKNI
ncbi:MAG: purine-nucleoside phosphorylase [Ignavibacteria bacterium]|nr:purine-nucleoside phosphorylase [Ignavibacteria bacterium]